MIVVKVIHNQNMIQQNIQMDLHVQVIQKNYVSKLVNVLINVIKKDIVWEDQ